MSKPRINLNESSPVSVDEEIGTLIIVILKAKNLNDKHFRKQDVYAAVTLNGVTKKTEVEIKGGQHPVWDAELRFPVLKGTGPKHRALEVACWSQEPRPKPDDLLGKGTVDLAETLKTGEFDDWVELQLDQKQRGEVYMEMTFFSNAPAPAPAKKPSNQPVAAPNKALQGLLSAGAPIQRRPSKLSPNDRLSRPGQGPAHGPSKLGMPGMPGGYPGSNAGGLPSSLQPSFSNGKLSPTRDALPPLPNQTNGSAALPAFLRPGGAGGRQQPSPAPNVAQQQAYGHGRHPSTSPPPSLLAGNPYTSSTAPISNPYIGGATTPPHQSHQGPPAPSNPYISSQPPPPQNIQHQQPPAWRHESHTGTSPIYDAGIQGAGGFAFPLPISSPVQENFGHIGGYPGHQVQGGYGYPGGSIPDPAHLDLITRYSTPLPLPPGARKTSVSTSAPAPAPQPAVPTYQNYDFTPAPPPKVASPAQAPAPPPAVPTYQNYDFTPAPPPRVTSATSDDARIAALRRAEEDARRRHEQEQRDLELALKLDRELNL